MVDFRLLQTPDYFAGGVNALQAGQQARTARERQNALSQYGTDPAGARNALLGLGDVQTVGQLQDIEGNDQAMRLRDTQEGRAVAGEGRAVAQEDRAAQASQIQQAMQINGVLVNAAKAVGAVPAAQRDAYFDSIVPELQRQGVPDEAIQHMRVAPKDDAALDQFEQLLGQQSTQLEAYTLSPGSARYEGGRKIAEQPFAPSYQTLSPGQQLYQSGGATGATAPSPAGGGISIESLTGLVNQVAPGATISSGLRTPEHNAEVGGVANSYHLSGQAVDVVPPRGMTTAQLAAQLQASSGGKLDVIDEGSHVHLEPSPQPAQPASGPRLVAQAAPRAEQANAPVGFRYKQDGTLEFIPGGPADPAVSASARNLRPVPSGVMTGLTANNQLITNIDRVIGLIQANPGAVGLVNAVPGVAGARNRLPGDTNSGGTSVRAALAGISAAKIHALSGAAVTPTEFERLKAYIPLLSDNSDMAIDKLNNLKAELQQLVDQTQAAYGPDTGYRELTPSSGSTSPAPAAPTASRGSASSLSDADIKAQLGL